MGPNLPVPSKAALTALRGLALGTSCTLALVVEDRRRRINKALQVVENGRKIKAHRFYRADGTAVALALEEEVMLDAVLDAGTVSSWSSSQFSPASVAQRRREDKHRGRELWESRSHNLDEYARRSQVANNAHAPAERLADHIDDASTKKLSVRTPPTSPHQGPFRNPFSTCMRTHSASPTASQNNVLRHEPKLQRSTFPTPEEIEEFVRQACKTRDAKQLDGAVHVLDQAHDSGLVDNNTNDTWVLTSALLCRTCEELGRVDDAVKILGRVLSLGPMRESDYFSHGPVQLVQRLLARAMETTPQSSEAEKLAAKRAFDMAVELYLPRFTAKPVHKDAEYLKVGLDLMRWASSLRVQHRTEEIYWRIFSLQDGKGHELTTSFIEALERVHNPKLAIRLFRLNYLKLSPPASSLFKVGDAIVKCVEDARGHGAKAVLELLLIQGNAVAAFRAQWAIRLLHAYWKRCQDVENVDELFKALIKAPAWKFVRFHDGPYRVMIEIALESGNQDRAESYLNELCADKPSFRQEIRINGLFALTKAKAEDWDGVRTHFENMKVDGTQDSRRLLCQVFVPVLKEYTKKHDLPEIEDFLRYYAEHFKVPPAHYLVSLMATQYAKAQDMESFFQWIRYCGAAGFEVDHSFGNAILMACAKHRKLPFSGLRRVYSILKKMCPDLVDRSGSLATANMALRARTVQNNAYKARERLQALHVVADKHLDRRQCADERGVLAAMTQAIHCGQPERAIKIYRTQSQDSPFSPWLFRLAVQAGIAVNQTLAFYLVQDARGKGHDISQGLSLLLEWEFRQLTCETKEVRLVPRTVRDILSRFKKYGLPMDQEVLNKAGRACLRLRAFSQAIKFAVLAASRKDDKLGYSLYNFVTAVQAYAALTNADGVRHLIRTALSSSYTTDLVCLQALKRARAMVQQHEAPTDMARCVQNMLTEAIGAVVEARKGMRQQQGKFEEKALGWTWKMARDKGRIHERSTLAWVWKVARGTPGTSTRAGNPQRRGRETDRPS